MKETEGQKAWNEYWRQENPKIHKKHNIMPIFIIIAIIISIISLFMTGKLKLPSDGNLDIETARYIDALTNVEHNIKTTLQYMSESNNNIVESQKRINDLDEYLKVMEEQGVFYPYKSFKEATDKDYKAIIDTLHTVLDSNNLDNNVFVQIIESFNKAQENRMNSIIKLFDENKIKYKIKKNNDGSTELEFHYKTIK